jgi:GNAT superfamily N-acetyltransferase
MNEEVHARVRRLMRGVTYRRATPDELAKGAPLFASLASLCAVCLCEPRDQRELQLLISAQHDSLSDAFAGPARRQQDAVGRSAIWLASDPNGLLVGTCGVQTLVMSPEGETRMTRRNKPTLEVRPLLSNLVVAPEWRRRGVASRLLQESESMVRAWGFEEMLLKVEAANAAAIQMYLRGGYVSVGIDAGAERPRAGLVRVRWERTTLLCMRKRLPAPDEDTGGVEGKVGVALPGG